MSVSEVYILASKAKTKLTREASHADHDLRKLVAHANMLDALMDHISTHPILPEQTTPPSEVPRKVSFSIPSRKLDTITESTRFIGESEYEEEEYLYDSDSDTESDYEYDDEEEAEYVLTAPNTKAEIESARNSYRIMPTLDLSNAEESMQEENRIPALSYSSSSEEEEEEDEEEEVELRRPKPAATQVSNDNKKEVNTADTAAISIVV